MRRSLSAIAHGRVPLAPARPLAPIGGKPASPLRLTRSYGWLASTLVVYDLVVRALCCERPYRKGILSTCPEPIPPTLLICHLCRCVHAEAEALKSGWMTKEAYRKATGIDPITCRLKHTYCPACHDYLLSQSRVA